MKTKHWSFFIFVFLLGFACKSKEYLLHPVHKSNYPSQLIHYSIDTINNVALKAQYLGNTDDELVFWIQIENLSKDEIDVNPATFYYKAVQINDDQEKVDVIRFSNRTSSGISAPKESKKKSKNKNASQSLLPTLSFVIGQSSDLSSVEENDPYRTFLRGYSENTNRSRSERQVHTLLEKQELRFLKSNVPSQTMKQGYVTFPIPNYFSDLTLCIQMEEKSTALDFVLD